MKDFLSIVVPCKNEEHYIGHLLDSLRDQVSIDGVKIIIADASTDNTREVIRDLKGDLNVEIVEGGPVSVAKNNGAEIVDTPYLLFIDSDVRFFSRTVIIDTLTDLITRDLDLIGLKIKCYDNDVRATMGFMMFNIVNKIMSRWVPFAVGAYMLTRTQKFRDLGGFPNRYPTSEDFFLSKMYDPKKFMLSNHYFGQDSRRFKKMGYFGMVKYLIKNFVNRNNEKHWANMDEKKYWD